MWGTVANPNLILEEVSSRAYYKPSSISGVTHSSETG